MKQILFIALILFAGISVCPAQLTDSLSNTVTLNEKVQRVESRLIDAKAFVKNLILIFDKELKESLPKMNILDRMNVYNVPGDYWSILGSLALPGFTLVLIGYSFIRTVLVSKSKVLHSSGNIILMGIFWEMTFHKGYTEYFVSETGILTGVACVFVAVMFWKVQKNETNILNCSESIKADNNTDY